MFDFSQIPERDLLQGTAVIHAGAENIHELVHLCHKHGIIWNPGYQADDAQIQQFADLHGEHAGLRLDRRMSGIRYRFIAVIPTDPHIHYFHSERETEINSTDILAMLG